MYVILSSHLTNVILHMDEMMSHTSHSPGKQIMLWGISHVALQKHRTDKFIGK